jgi:glutathione S-transferase
MRKPSHSALNPNDLIPRLEDGGFVLWESNVTMQYLADKAGDDRLFSRRGAGSGAGR